MTFINNHPEYPWDWERVGADPNLTMDMINNHPNKDQ